MTSSYKHQTGPSPAYGRGDGTESEDPALSICPPCTRGTVQSAPLPLVVRAPATLEAKQSLTFKAEFDGPVQAKNYQEGDVIAKDQWLIKIWPRKDPDGLQTKSDAVKNAKADLIKAERKRSCRECSTTAKRCPVQRGRCRAGASPGRTSVANGEEAFRLEQITLEQEQTRCSIRRTVIKDFIGNQPTVASGKEILTLADVSGFRSARGG